MFRKLGTEQRRIDDKEDILKSQDEKYKAKCIEIDKRLQDVKEREEAATLKQQQIHSTMASLEDRDRKLDEQAKKYRITEGELRSKQEALLLLEADLKLKEGAMKLLDSKELELQSKIEKHLAVEKDFYTNRVHQITARHSTEMDILEKIVIKILQCVSNFKLDLDKYRSDLVQNNITQNLSSMIAKTSELTSYSNTLSVAVARDLDSVSYSYENSIVPITVSVFDCIY